VERAFLQSETYDFHIVTDTHMSVHQQAVRRDARIRQKLQMRLHKSRATRRVSSRQSLRLHRDMGESRWRPEGRWPSGSNPQDIPTQSHWTGSTPQGDPHPHDIPALTLSPPHGSTHPKAILTPMIFPP
jgi:hypothetical protein